jgi:glyoxylase-like metal-dependent hydrolase (beta-lactamase superfamily II)
VRILAPNPGPFTLEGTNTWVVGADPSIVVNPGPDDPEHLAAIARAAAPIVAIVLTHHHEDHAMGAAGLALATGAPVIAADPRGDERAVPASGVLEAGGVRLRVISAPGHTPDHVVLFDEASRILFTGDAVLGRGTSVIDPPEGDLEQYLRSLGVMLELRPAVICPGHGPTIWDAEATLRGYIDHRSEREREVLHGLTRGPATPEALVPEIYAEHPPELRPIAARSVLAHLLKLEREGRVVRTTAGPSDEFALAETHRAAAHPAASSLADATASSGADPPATTE